MANSSKTGVTDYATPNDTDFVITRVAAAPCGRVFAAWTDPKILPRWLLGPDGWTMTLCEVDLRPGGKWRYEWRKAGGQEMAIEGVFREVDRPRRVVTTENWGAPWPQTVNTLEFEERDGLTTMRLTIRYPSKRDREAATATGMKAGMDATFARLDAFLAE